MTASALAVFVCATIAAVLDPCAGLSYQETGDCEVCATYSLLFNSLAFFPQATHENLYKYHAEEVYFGDEIDQTFEITIYFRVYCKSGMFLSLRVFLFYMHAVFAVGMYGPNQAKLYDLDVTETNLGGNIVEREESENANDDRAVRDYNAKMAGWFQFVQTEDGSIPVTRFSREEDREIVNIKKAVVSAFQANFKGTSTKEEADPQSLHTSEYTYVSLRM